MTTRTATHIGAWLLFLYLFFSYVVPYVMPFAIGLGLAFLLEPAAGFLVSRVGLKRSRAVALVVLALVGVVGVLLTAGISRVVRELTELSKALPNYYSDFSRVLGEILRVAGDISSQLPEPLAKAALEQWNRVASLIGTIVAGAGGAFLGLPAFSVTTIFTFLTTYFVMKDRPAIGQFARSMFSAETFARLQKLEGELLVGLAGFLRAQLTLTALTTVVNVFGLTLLGSRYAVAVGLTLSVLDILPVVGPGLFILPWALYHVFWGTTWFAIGIVVMYAVISIFRQTAQTQLVGRELGLHPLVTLVSIYAGYKLFGTVGLLYGPFSAIVLKALWSGGAIPHGPAAPS